MVLNGIGDHLGSFELPSGERAAGLLSLEPDQLPVVHMHSGVATPALASSPWSPSAEEVSILRGDLRSNDEAILGDVQLEEVFPGQFRAIAGWALIGLGIASLGDRGWTGVELRASGLNLLLGRAIQATGWPPDEHASPQRYSADLASARYESEHEAVSITASYDQSATIGDPFRFELTNYPTLRLESPCGLSVSEWINRWISPTLYLLALATGRIEHLQTVALLGPEIGGAPIPRRRRAQLFGRGIQQDDSPATERVGPDGLSELPLFTLAVAPPLATLIAHMRDDADFATANSLYRLAVRPGTPSGVQFLLCMQAVEALHSAGQRSQEDKAHAEYRERRAALLVDLRSRVTVEELRFLQKHLGRSPFRSLAARLQQVLAEIPDSARRQAAWTAATAHLASELASLGRHSSPVMALHECLASTRNALSHGIVLAPELTRPAAAIGLMILRGMLLQHLGFTAMGQESAFTRMESRS